MTKTVELPNFRRMMREVQLGEMSAEGAAAAIDEYIRSEVARRTAPDPDIELGLHPLNTVQDCADRIARDHGIADRMVVVLMREYALLRRRMSDDRLRAAVEDAPRPAPKPIKNAEQQLFDVLRELGQAKGDRRGK